MPELPEVETMVRGVRPAVEGARLLRVSPCPCACRPLTISPAWAVMRRRTAGRTLAAVRRRAKRIVLELDDGQAFVIEPRMTGLMLLSDPPDEAHLRVVWTLERAGRQVGLWFWDRRGLGTVRLYSAAELADALESGRLGPDALDMTPALWRKLLAGTSRPVKVALLDQHRVAGIGNLYASEILFLAGINPRIPACMLTPRQSARLHAATRDVLEEAIRYEGSTLSDGTYRNAQNQSGRYQNEHRVYDREGEPCGTCRRTTIVRVVQAQRSTFFCPRCQREFG